MSDRDLIISQNAFKSYLTPSETFGVAHKTFEKDCNSQKAC